MPRFTPTVELAPGADLTAVPSTWSWTDLTLLGGYVHDPAGITITRGRTNRNATTSPSTCGLTLLNDNGIWVPDNPLSPYYGLLDINTPLRVLMRPNTNTAQDAFGRTTSSSWGSADTGGAWTNTGGTAANFSVSPTTGGRHLHAAAASIHTSTLAFSLYRSDITVRVRVNATSTGAAQTVGIVSRYQNSSNFWRAELQFGTSGTITARIVSRTSGSDGAAFSAVTPYTHSTSTWYRIRLQTGLNTGRFKLWLDGTAEPATWLIDGANGFFSQGVAAGAVGLYSVRETGNTNTNATFDFDDFSMVDGVYSRFTGYVDAWPATWTDASERQSLAPITASGHMRRLANGKVLRSAIFRAMSADANLVGYWPMEGGTSSTQFSSGIGGAPVPFAGISAGADSDVAGSDPLPKVSTTGRVVFGIPPYPPSDKWSIRFLLKVPSSPTASAQVLSWSTPGGTFARWQLTLFGGSPDTMRLEGYNAAGAATFVDSSVNMTDDDSGAELTNGRQLYIEVDGAQNGANIDLAWTAWYVPDSGKFSATGIGRSPSVAGTIANVTLVSHDANSGFDVEHTIGHIAVGSDIIGTSSVIAVAGGKGEKTSARLNRLCNEEHVAVIFGEILGNPSGDTNQTMGPQPSASLLDQLREIEATEAGVLFDGLQGQVTILPRQMRRSHAVNLTLDHRQIKEGFSSAWDDQLVRNDIQVTNATGTVATAADKTGQSVRGVYSDPVRINAQSDTDATQHASWRLHLGKTPERRYPAFTFDLHNSRNTSIIDAWLACDIGYRVNVTNLPNMYGNVADLLIEGYTETINQSVWTVTLNCSPAQPYQVWTIQGSGNSGRLDTTGSYNSITASSGDTLLAVYTPSGPQWSTTAVPYDVGVSGERVTATAVVRAIVDDFSRTVSNGWGTATSGQVWAVDGTASAFSVGSGVGMHTVAARNTLYRSRLVGVSFTDFDLRFVSLVGATLTGDYMRTEVFLRYVDSSNYYSARIHREVSGAVSLQIVRLLAGVETVLSALTSVITHTAGISLLVQAGAMGSTLRARIWRDGTDDTGVWEITATDSSIAAGSLGIGTLLPPSNTNTLPVQAVYAEVEVANPQIMTVTRSVNGVVKSLPAGAAVSLWKPGVIAL